MGQSTWLPGLSQGQERQARSLRHPQLGASPDLGAPLQRNKGHLPRTDGGWVTFHHEVQFTKSQCGIPRQRARPGLFWKTTHLLFIHTEEKAMERIRLYILIGGKTLSPETPLIKVSFQAFG